MTIRRVLSALLLLAIAAAPAAAAGKPRRVEVRYDITKPLNEALEIWIDCDHDTSQTPFQNLSRCTTVKAQLKGVDAARFVFSDKDQITFVLFFERDADSKSKGDITYAITGTGVSDTDIAAFRKIVAADASTMGEARTLGGRANDAVIKALTDDIDIGQKVVVTFSVKETTTTDGKEVEKTTDSSGALPFRVGGAPRFKLSYGLAFSNAPSPEVAIVKTSTIIDFQKDGKPAQAYEQMIVLRDADASLGIIQSLVTMANFRIASAVYGSVGFQTNQKIFEEPILGLTYRHQIGRLGLNVTGGVHFSRETFIREDSGFSDGMRIDPTQALTVDDIPTDTKTRHRFALAFTVDFR